MEILIVDDEKDLGTFVRMKLSKEAPDFSIAIVESGSECLEFIRSHPVDCIISDYQMPGMNGMELLLSLRNEGSDTPFIFLTGQGNEEVAREAFKNGASDYFTKDMGFAYFTRIINSIEQAVRLRASRAKHLKVEEAVRNTAEGVSAKTGEMFFRSLTQYLAKALGVKYAFIGEIDENDPGHARTVAFWAGEGFADTFEYNLINTPCDNVVKENLRCYPKDLQKLFPKDEYSAQFNVESYSGTPLWDSSGRVIGLLVVFDSKPMEDEENVKALLKVFASRASAELERLKADRAFKALDRQKEDFFAMVEDFLSVSRMEAGRLALDLSPSDISRTLKEAHAELEGAIREKGLIYNEEFAAGLPATLLMDRKLVQRAVYNLLQNSINRTPQGGRITLKAEEVTGKDGGYAVVSVTDTGQGIPPKTTGVKGTGLGLAIVKAVAEAHGGRVELQSEAAKGSTFRLFLPVVRPAPASP